jgi:hypothetical protein
VKRARDDRDDVVTEHNEYLDRVKCYICQGHGHLAKDCPDSMSFLPHMLCFCCPLFKWLPLILIKCNVVCPTVIEPSKPCFECDGIDHLAKDCPSKKPRNCLVCDTLGHVAADCPALAKLQTGNHSSVPFGCILTLMLVWDIQIYHHYYPTLVNNHHHVIQHYYKHVH